MNRVLRIVGMVWLLAAGVRVDAQCIGDCTGDGSVTVEEIVRGVNIALGMMDVATCSDFDRNTDRLVTVDELVGALRDARDGCGSESTPTPTVTPKPTATTVNLAPVAPSPRVYRTFAGQEVSFAIGGSDPEGQVLTYAATDLPAGASVDGSTGIFGWTPSAEQIGPFYLPVTISDGGSPPASTGSELTFKVSPLDACTVPNCDPAGGCDPGLVPSAQLCCTGEPLPRVEEPRADCPEGLVFSVGRNRDGFGRMQNCDQLRVSLLGQGGIGVRIHVETRCVTTIEPVSVFLRIETADRVLVDETAPSGAPQPRVLFLDLDEDGFARMYGLLYEATDSLAGIEGQEANLTATIMDLDARVVLAREQIRVRITLNSVADLPETP